MTEPLFIIPARGGSKGIPGKNIKPLGGSPLIYRSIDLARQFVSDEHICLTTDSQEIIDCAQRHGLNVPFVRPDSLATDTCGSREVMLHALDFYAAQGRDYSNIVLLQPTSPFRRAEDVKGAIDLYTPDLDMVVSVKDASSNPYYNNFEESADGFLHISKGDGLYVRRQDCPKTYEYNGAVYVINAQSLREGPMGKFKKIVKYEMDAMHSVDLDTPLDWQLAELLIANNMVE